MMGLRKYVFILSTIIGILFILFPQWDIEVSRYFYDVNFGFIYAKSAWAEIIFRAIPIIATITTGFLILGISVKYFTCYNKSECLKSPLVFLLIALVLGPAFTVNFMLKENFGRARPREIMELGGDKQFSPAGYYVAQCRSNCSFTSGHASMGFYFTSLAWIVPPSYSIFTFICGTLLGYVVGFGRIVQGGHFLSDVIFSFIVVMIANEVSFRIWNRICKKIR